MQPLGEPFEHLARYHGAGWAVVALHSITRLSPTVVACSCERGADPDHYAQAGKHPLGKGWQAKGMHSWPDVVATWQDRPNSNVGVVTGAPSGIWVLDVDPEHGGAQRLRDLIASEGGGVPLPSTYIVQTGSGGWHLYWRMPTDFEPTNSRGRLPAGLDVRGTGGQVVAPPSASGKGLYRVLDASSVTDAPPWLLDLIRPRELTAVAMTSSAGSVMLAELPGPERDRVGRYARTAVAAELDRVATSIEGTRNETAFAAACSIHELLNAQWSSLDPGAVWRGFAAAVDRCGLPPGEGLAVWGSAAARIGLRARDLPRLPDVAWDPPPLVTAPASSNGAAHADASMEFAGDASGVVVDPVALMRSRVLSSPGLDLVKPLDPLITGYLSLDTCAWIIGQPGHGKSFVALDMALSVATGHSWHGSRVEPGLALYVAAEGARGVRARVRAWESRYYEGKTVDRFGIYPDPVQVGGPEWPTFVAMCAIDQPDLIVFDTQARVSTLFDENSNSEMGRFIEAVEGLRRVSGACVLIVHHETKSGGTARGASAILGAAQTELTVTRDRDLVLVRTTKQKDHEPAADLMLRMEPESGAPVAGDDGLANPALGSVVLVAAGGEIPGMTEHPAALRARLTETLQNESDRALVDVMMRSFAESGNGWTRADIRAEYLALGRFKRTTFYASFDRLASLGIIGRVGGSTERYRFVSIADREPTPLDEMDVTDE